MYYNSDIMRCIAWFVMLVIVLINGLHVQMLSQFRGAFMTQTMAMATSDNGNDNTDDWSTILYAGPATAMAVLTPSHRAEPASM